MRLKFLCNTHRHSLLEDPEAARSLWLGLCDQLQAEPAVATPQRVRAAGSALEAAGIYLLANPAVDAGVLHRYSDTAERLIELLVQLNQTRLAIVVISGANAMVEHLARCGADREAALAVCRRLTLQGMGQIERGSGFRPVSAAGRPPAARAATVH